MSATGPAAIGAPLITGCGIRHRSGGALSLRRTLYGVRSAGCLYCRRVSSEHFIRWRAHSPGV